MTRSTLLVALVYLGLCAPARVAADGGAQFGSVRHGSLHSPIRWQDPSQVELHTHELRFTRPGATLRSEPLPLAPLQHYRISTTMARGPGSKPRFAITYLDAQGKTIEWTPAWQHKHGTHADWLPLSPHEQHYVQAIVLPPDASQPRLVLRLEARPEKALARYDHWTLSALVIEAAGPVAGCTRLGENLLWNGDFEDGFDAQWTRSSAALDDRIERIRIAQRDGHVLRIQPGAPAHLFSRYMAPVNPGRAYRLSLKARGRGRIRLDAHSHSRDRPLPLRVGNHTHGTSPHELDSEMWRELSTLWFAEAPNVSYADVVITLDAHSPMEIDAVELRPCQ